LIAVVDRLLGIVPAVGAAGFVPAVDRRTAERRGTSRELTYERDDE
jgi:hypothetical protein